MSVIEKVNGIMLSTGIFSNDPNSTINLQAESQFHRVSNGARVMSVGLKDLQRMACRHVALEQNERLFLRASDLERRADALLEHPQLDALLFHDYQKLKALACQQYVEAIAHREVIERDFPEAVLPREENQRKYLVAGVTQEKVCG